MRSLSIAISPHQHLAKLRLGHTRPLQFLRPEIDLRHIEGLGVECSTQPFLHARVLGVSTVPQNLQQVLIASDTATVLRRTGPSTGKAEGNGGRDSIRCQQLLDRDLVFP